MTNAYLNIAERVLEEARSPLTPAQILQRAYVSALVPDHLYGSTQHKTLHARLSEDISRHLESSRFYRTAPGTFFLRSMSKFRAHGEAFAEYHAPPRKKGLRRDAILVANMDAALSQRSGRSISIEIIKAHFDSGNYAYRHWQDINADGRFLPVQSFVVVTQSDRILSYRVGKFTPKSDPLTGLRSVGFGGAILASEIDLLFDSFFGIVANAINELIYGIGLPRRTAEEARYRGGVKLRFATVTRSPSTGVDHLNVVMSYHCPADFLPTKSALSLNQLRWLEASSRINNLEAFDETSRLILSTDLIGRILAGD